MLARSRADPCAFIEALLIDPETNKPFVLYAEQKTFLRRAVAVGADGRLLFPELIFSAPKKSGKTALAAMTAIYFAVCLCGSYGEILLIANDEEQSIGRVFTSCSRILQASPALRNAVKIGQRQIEFRATRTTITALPQDFAGNAGANPNLVVADEPWAMISERARRAFDEMVPSPAKKISARLSVSYAGFAGESELLESLYQRGLRGVEIAPDLRETDDGLLMFWSNRLLAPWQSDAWRSQMQSALRPNQYRRMILNEWVAAEEQFIDAQMLDACTDADARSIVSDPQLSVWVGLDASVVRDMTAIVAVAFDSGRVRLINHVAIQPTKDSPIDFEREVESVLLDWHRRYKLRVINYDPWQLLALSQRMLRRGLPMQEFPQTVGNLTSMGSNLFDLIKGRNLLLYESLEVRRALLSSVAIESSRGWRIGKTKSSDKIDLAVALAMACHAVVNRTIGPSCSVRSLYGGAADVSVPDDSEPDTSLPVRFTELSGSEQRFFATKNIVRY